MFLINKINPIDGLDGCASGLRAIACMTFLRNSLLPDKAHIHHKLLVLGISPSVAMSTIVFASLVLTLVNYILSHYVNIALLLCIDLGVWIGANVALRHAIRRCELRFNKILYE